MKYFILFALVFPFCSYAETCSFPTRNDRMVIDDCAKLELKLTKAALSQIKFDANGLSGGSIQNQGCYWIKRNGEMKRTHCYDNGADAFAEGVTRYIDDNGRFGYMNKKLQVVIQPQFTFAFPFQGPTAWACNGCVRALSKGGEHSTVEGGEWMTVDKKGKITKCQKAYDFQSCGMAKKPL